MTSLCFAVTESIVAAAALLCTFTITCLLICGHVLATRHSVSYCADMWTCPGDSSQFELLWVRVQAHRHEVVIAALYHPPKPLYKPTALLDYIEAGVDALTAVFPKAAIVLAGDFNSLDDSALVSRTSLSSVVTQPTRGANILDRIYVNDVSYATVRVVTSTIRSNHKAIIAYAGQPLQPLNKTRQRLVFRRRSPAQTSNTSLSSILNLTATLPCRRTSTPCTASCTSS